MLGVVFVDVTLSSLVIDGVLFDVDRLEDVIGGHAEDRAMEIRK